MMKLTPVLKGEQVRTVAVETGEHPWPMRLRARLHADTPVPEK